MKIKVIVTLKSGVLDPQGKAIQQTLNGMGFANVKDVRQGKYFDINIDENIAIEPLFFAICNFSDNDKYLSS